ncbi:hypothetical protein [Allokutzneria oryzae]|uniref:Uncharacterized protein n=1 Tax=Allokutzneria oryzae TaxID=1378989 RepID=A0ABV5ZTN0_9PSEU
MTKRVVNALIAAAVSCSVALAGSGAASAAHHLDGARPMAAMTATFDPQVEPALVQFFTDILSIPDEVLVQGDQATQSWISVNIPPRAAKHAAAPGTVLGCISAIGQALAGLALPAFKIMKIKRLINDVGGLWEAVRLALGGTSAAEKGEAIATAFAALIAELSGISGISQHCFN